MFDLRVNNYQQTILTIAQDFNHIRNFRTLYIDRENCPLYNSRKFNPNFFLLLFNFSTNGTQRWELFTKSPSWVLSFLSLYHYFPKNQQKNNSNICIGSFETSNGNDEYSRFYETRFEINIWKWYKLLACNNLLQSFSGQSYGGGDSGQKT